MAMLFVFASQFILYFDGKRELIHIFFSLNIICLVPILHRRRIIFLSIKTPKKKLLAFIITSLYCLIYYGSFSQKFTTSFDSIGFVFSLLASFVAVTATLRQTSSKSYNYLLLFIGLQLFVDFLVTIYVRFHPFEYFYLLTRPIFIGSYIFLILSILEDRKYMGEKEVLIEN